MSTTNKKRPVLQPKKNRGSAGNARSSRVGVPGGAQEIIATEQFRRNCDRFMVEHVPTYRIFNFQGRDVTQEMIQHAAEKRKREPMEVTRFVWRSKQLRAGC